MTTNYVEYPNARLGAPAFIGSNPVGPAIEFASSYDECKNSGNFQGVEWYKNTNPNSSTPNIGRCKLYPTVKCTFPLYDMSNPGNSGLNNPDATFAIKGLPACSKYQTKQCNVTYNGNTNNVLYNNVTNGEYYDLRRNPLYDGINMHATYGPNVWGGGMYGNGTPVQDQIRGTSNVIMPLNPGKTCPFQLKCTYE